MPTYKNIYFKKVHQANVYTVLMIQAHTHSQLEFRINVLLLCLSECAITSKGYPVCQETISYFLPSEQHLCDFITLLKPCLAKHNLFRLNKCLRLLLNSQQFDDYKRLPCRNPRRRKRRNDNACFIITLIYNNNRFILQPLYRRAKPNFPPETVTAVESGGVRTRGRL